MASLANLKFSAGSIPAAAPKRYRRSTTCKAPRKRTFIAQMEKTWASDVPMAGGKVSTRATSLGLFFTSCHGNSSAFMPGMPMACRSVSVNCTLTLGGGSGGSGVGPTRPTSFSGDEGGAWSNTNTVQGSRLLVGVMALVAIGTLIPAAVSAKDEPVADSGSRASATAAVLIPRSNPSSSGMFLGAMSMSNSSSMGSWKSASVGSSLGGASSVSREAIVYGDVQLSGSERRMLTREAAQMHFRENLRV